MRGRKPKEESRAAEIRAKLAAWRRMPDSSRPSLRALARELGTSHQLLSHYLQRWEKWQAKECHQRANEIRTRAEAENRSLTAWEEQQAHADDQTAVQSMMESMFSNTLRQLERDAKDGRLAAIQVKMLRLLASRGYGKAQKILEKLSGTEKSKNNLPVLGSRAAKSFRSHRRVAGNSAKTVPRVRLERIEGMSEK
jgi:hypothetical protein